MKAFLRWAGSKRQLVPKLRRFWTDEYARYVEPFMGSACLFFDIQPRVALLADLNEELVNALTQVRDNPTCVWKCIDAYPQGRTAYYDLRSVDPATLVDKARAARFIYLNRFCFNGLYRTNLQGQFNVPYAASGTGSLPSKDVLIRCARVLKYAEIKACDFRRTLAEVQENDFVYMDPPFAVAKRRVFKEYGPRVFGSDDVAELGEILGRIDKTGAYFVVSYADCTEGRKLLAPWKTVRVRTRRNIAGFATSRGVAYELVAANIP